MERCHKSFLLSNELQPVTDLGDLTMQSRFLHIKVDVPGVCRFGDYLANNVDFMRSGINVACRSVTWTVETRSRFYYGGQRVYAVRFTRFPSCTGFFRLYTRLAAV